MRGVVARVLMVLCLGHLCFGCASATSSSSPAASSPKASQAPATQIATTPALPKIVVIKSSDNPLYRLPVDLFIAQVHADVRVLTMEDGAPAKDVLRLVDQIEPRLVVTLGAKALVLATRHIDSVPVLFAMVLNYRRFNVKGRANYMGIELETPPVTEFTQFKMIVPTMKNILVPYGDAETKTLLDAAQHDLEPLGLTLRPMFVKSADALARAYANLAEEHQDGIWLVSDSVAMAKSSFAFFRQQALDDRIPLMCSLSDSFAKEGALMSVSIDFRNLGSQAAHMATLLLEKGDKPEAIGIQPSIGGHLVVNLATARQIGLAIDDEIVPFINEVVSN